ncbi:MAG: diadenylate cyclase CdaA [Deltaproteobacteria bacterium]|nr:diadenylate cyclase CdaA [Deltaproteobacteria bacterium]
MLSLLLQNFRWQDIVDILFVTFIIYRILMLIKGTGAFQVLIGLIVIFLIFLIAVALKLYATEFIFGDFLSSIIIVIVVLFRNEIRKALIDVGKNPFAIAQNKLEKVSIIEETSHAVIELANKQTGAIIVFERNVFLGDYLKIGIKLDSLISQELLISIFTPPSPLHDGAVIIQKGRITAASCYLPLSTEENIDQNFGTRHRSAIGLSELTDALSIVISEETGHISVVMPKKIIKISNIEELKTVLFKNTSEQTNENKLLLKSVYELIFGTNKNDNNNE